MKSIVAFVIAAIAAALLIVGSVAAWSVACATQGAGSRGTSPVQIRNDFPRATEDVGFVLFIRTRAILAQASPEPAPALSGWRQNFLCEVKATDIALAGFALFLVLASVYQGLWLWRAVRATERSAKIVDQALIASQRAYVVFKEFRVNITRMPPLDEITNCTIQPVWENSGTTPTRSGRTHVNWRYFERSIPSEFDLADFDDVGNRILAYDSYAPLVIGPKSTSFSSVITIDASTVRMVREMQGRVLIWGWAEYDDIFNDSGRHRTEFCYQMIVTGNTLHSQVGFSQFRRFNGVDEDCERKPTKLARQ